MTEKFIRMQTNKGAILNTDNDGLRAYKLAKKRAMEQIQEINTMKQDIAEIKSIMSQLLEKLK